MQERRTPPGWPVEVPPPGADGWEESAASWLLDQCPADYRGHEVWRRHPVALAWVAAHHLSGQVTAMRDAYRSARVDLADDIPPDTLPEVLLALETEGLRLRAAARGAELVADALRGRTYVPRL